MYIFFVDPTGPFEKALDAVCAVDREMSVQTLLTFVRISRRLSALNSGAVSLAQVAEEMDVGYSSLLRQTDCLAAGGPSVRALNLLEKVVSSQDRRSRNFRLTDRGEALMVAVADCMSEMHIPAASAEPVRINKPRGSTAANEKSRKSRKKR
ncbi:hypothetical protein [Bradyrhizobium sp. CCBAU 21360]|uniref:hypothetical protein n=1 Tax=Bradyrhizobium sp. CCBAU 21360 TaxID=1325081 RepID=UPI002306281C|nr:hypothetical protein [Bradyrhizobium sp. CCBAU 21360]MDA9452324.1 hypothetical protein [Bradyrhizobium sp. CCBAU 21360]